MLRRRDSWLGAVPAGGLEEEGKGTAYRAIRSASPPLRLGNGRCQQGRDGCADPHGCGAIFVLCS